MKFQQIKILFLILSVIPKSAFAGVVATKVETMNSPIKEVLLTTNYSLNPNTKFHFSLLSNAMIFPGFGLPRLADFKGMSVGYQLNSNLLAEYDYIPVPFGPSVPLLKEDGECDDCAPGSKTKKYGGYISEIRGIYFLNSPFYVSVGAFHSHYSEENTSSLLMIDGEPVQSNYEVEHFGGDIKLGTRFFIKTKLADLKNVSVGADWLGKAVGYPIEAFKTGSFQNKLEAITLFMLSFGAAI